MNIRRHLWVGRDRAVTIGALAELLSVPRRSVEEAIQEARLSGVPVCTGSSGAWLAETPQEARETASRLRDRAIHQMETAAALERWADQQDSGQTALWEAA